jgi:hypothetical protein
VLLRPILRKSHPFVAKRVALLNERGIFAAFIAHKRININRKKPFVNFIRAKVLSCAGAE